LIWMFGSDLFFLGGGGGGGVLANPSRVGSGGYFYTKFGSGEKTVSERIYAVIICQ
jgi:hypothetical protein